MHITCNSRYSTCVTDIIIVKKYSNDKMIKFLKLKKMLTNATIHSWLEKLHWVTPGNNVFL